MAIASLKNCLSAKFVFTSFFRSFGPSRMRIAAVTKYMRAYEGVRQFRSTTVPKLEMCSTKPKTDDS